MDRWQWTHWPTSTCRCPASPQGRPRQSFACPTNHPRTDKCCKKQISRINPHEQYLEPIGGSHSIGALRSYNARLNSLKIEANNRAHKIANGHGFAKHRYLPRHRQSKGQTRFSDIHSRDEYARRIYDTIVNGTHSTTLKRGRIDYYNTQTNTIVIFNPANRDGGSSYPAHNGIHTYYEFK